MKETIDNPGKARLADAPRPSLRGKAHAWLRALRLHFYPMSWVTYAVGALLAAGEDAMRLPVFWWGFGFIFFLEVATVLCNEYLDYATDQRNDCAGPFSGGSRVLVSGALSFAEIRRGIAMALLLSALAALGVLVFGAGSGWTMALLMMGLAFAALGYTMPPLKLAYRTLGEMDVAITDSIGVLLCGFVFLGGSWHAPPPWLLSLPLGLAFIPSITLAGIPDQAADQAVGKRTLAVRLGVPGAIRVAQVSAALAALTALLYCFFELLPGLYHPLILLSTLHALLLVAALHRRVARTRQAGRIDSLMVLSLSFVLWFGVVPLLMLLI